MGGHADVLLMFCLHFLEIYKGPERQEDFISVGENVFEHARKQVQMHHKLAGKLAD